jgi:thioredoxin 1
MSDSVIVPTSDAAFDQQVLKSTTPVLVDFWAEWCGPCKAIAPVLEQVAHAYAGKLIIAKINVDENPQIPAKYGIRGIPTLMLFKDGALAAQKVGAVGRANLEEFLNKHLQGQPLVA